MSLKKLKAFNYIILPTLTIVYLICNEFFIKLPCACLTLLIIMSVMLILSVIIFCLDCESSGILIVDETKKDSSNGRYSFQFYNSLADLEKQERFTINIEKLPKSHK